MGEGDSFIMDQLGQVGTAIVDCLDIADDQQHLDIAAATPKNPTTRRGGRSATDYR